MRSIAFVLMAAGSAALPSAPLAAPCAGFTDVEDAGPFCSAVAWLRNRQITLGCTPTNYCPDGFVTRGEMALFMNRLERQFPATLMDATGKAAGTLEAGSVSSAQPTRFALVYRTGGDVLALSVAMEPTRRWTLVDSGRAYFELPGCNGQVYGGHGYGPYQWNIDEHPAGGKRATLLVRGPGNVVYLYATAPFPVTAASVAFASHLSAGTCTDQSSYTMGVPVTLVEDLSLRFVQPFVAH